MGLNKDWLSQFIVPKPEKNVTQIFLAHTWNRNISNHSNRFLSLYTQCYSNPYQNTSKLWTEYSESITYLLRVKSMQPSRTTMHTDCDGLCRILPLLSVAPWSVHLPISGTLTDIADHDFRSPPDTLSRTLPASCHSPWEQ